MPAPLPEPHPNADSAPYWQGAAEGRLMLQHCTACGAVQFLARHLCAACWSDRLDWRAASGRGHVHSFTVIHRAPAPAFAARLPYHVALIDLEEGPRMLANLVGAGLDRVAIGAAVRVVFEARGAAKLPQFELAP